MRPFAGGSASVRKPTSMDGFRAVGPLEPHGPLSTRGMLDNRPTEYPRHLVPLPAPPHVPSHLLAKRVKHEEGSSDWHRHVLSLQLFGSCSSCMHKQARSTLCMLKSIRRCLQSMPNSTCLTTQRPTLLLTNSELAS